MEHTIFSLTYAAYQKRRLINLLPVNTPYSFFNPVVYEENQVYQVMVGRGKEILINDGENWEVTDDEDLIYLIILCVVKKVRQISIQFKEAV